jgi:uncharacterized protein
MRAIIGLRGRVRRYGEAEEQWSRGGWPYNDQVDLPRATLDANDRTRGVPIGTVDKFQGREAVVVLFSKTTSSGDMPRTAKFPFSRNRLNVAISRARCLAYLVCTEDLLNRKVKSVLIAR